MKRFLLQILAITLCTTISAEEYTISNEADWAIIKIKASGGHDFSGDIITLNTDIKSGGKLDCFNGILNGNNHTITSAGLIGKLLQEGEIHNLTVYFPANIRTESDNPIGGIADICHGLIHSCTAKVPIYQVIEGKHVIAGGVAGEVSATGRITLSHNEAAITGYVVDEERVYFSRVGGIAGWNHGLVAGCTNSATIKGTSYSTLMLGGIVGHADGTTSRVEGCTNKGRVQGTITRTESSANIYGRVGGVVGYAQNSEIISECFNSGYITTNVDNIGGILGVGVNTSLVNCANSGEVLNQQSYYYSCAGGICSSFKGDGIDKSLFLNCVNTGKVTSLTNPQFTATAGGICPNLYDCSFGNTLNFGTVGAEGKTKFMYDNICQERCSALHIAKTVSEANAYAKSSHLDKTRPWLLSWIGTNTSTTLSGQILQATSSFPGMIESYFGGSLATTAKLVATPTDGIVSSCLTHDRSCFITGLKPDTDYCIEWINTSGQALYRKNMHTQKLVFSTTISNIKSTSAFIQTDCETKGLPVASRGYTFGNGIGLISTIDADQDFKALLSNLSEDTQHFAIPTLHLASGEEIEGPTIYFETLRLQPIYDKIAVGPDWIKFRLLNQAELSEAGIENFGLSSHFMDNGAPTLRYLNGASDTIVLPDLKTRTSTGGGQSYPQKQRIGTFIYRNDIREDSEETTIVDLLHETMDTTVLAVSPNAVMVRGACDGFSLFLNRLNILHTSNTQTQEYADVTNTLKQIYYAVFPYKAGDAYLVGLEHARNDYSWSQSTTTPRIEVDLSKITCPIVPPYLLMPQIISGKKPYLEGIYVRGEVDWDFYFEYRDDLASEWIRANSTSTPPRFSLGDLPPGKDYHVRLSASNGNYKLSSRTACVSNVGLKYYLPPTSDEKLHSGIENTIMDAQSDMPTYIYNLSGRLIGNGSSDGIIPHLKGGIYIIRRGATAKKIFVKSGSAKTCTSAKNSRILHP